MQDPISTKAGDMLDVEVRGTDIALLNGNEIGENIRRSRLDFEATDELIRRLTAARDEAAAEADRQVDQVARMIAAELGATHTAARRLIASGYVVPATVLATKQAAGESLSDDCRGGQCAQCEICEHCGCSCACHYRHAAYLARTGGRCGCECHAP